MQDELILLRTPASRKKYGSWLRRVAVWDEKNEQTIELITYQMTSAASTNNELYKSRWQVEMFFREIKQNLHIKSFVARAKIQ